MSLWTNSHSSPAVIESNASYSPANLLESILAPNESMIRPHQRICVPKSVDLIRDTTRFLSQQICKKDDKIRNRLTLHLSWSANLSKHASKCPRSWPEQGSTHFWKFLEHLHPPWVVHVDCITPCGVMNAWSGWLSESIDNCEYPDVKSIVAKAPAPQTSSMTAFKWGIGHVFLNRFFIC